VAGDNGEVARASATSKATKRKKVHFMLKIRVRSGVDCLGEVVESRKEGLSAWYK
jgi:hypothetical protein